MERVADEADGKYTDISDPLDVINQECGEEAEVPDHFEACVV